MALAKKNRLNLRLHRLQVEKNCQKIHSPLFTYLVAKQEDSSPNSRFAILLSKKTAKKAVDRNKIRRAISNSIQGSLPLLPQNHDIILIPKKDILGKTAEEITKDLNHVQNI
jgi:ribonuclease P protein component